MAIVLTMRTKSGVRVNIDDKYAAAQGTPEHAEAHRQACEAAQAILEQVAKQKARQNHHN